MINPDGHSSTNIVSLVLQESAQELLGQETLLRFTAGLPSNTARVSGTPHNGSVLIAPGEEMGFFDALEQAYGIPGSRGLAVRLGRAAFKYGLNHLGEHLGLRAMDFRLLPAPRRILAGLETLAEEAGRLFGMESAVQDTGTDWHVRFVGGSLSSDQAGSGSVCYLVIGMLQEFMAWAGGGRMYRVTESECLVGGGSACVFRIEKKPLD